MIVGRERGAVVHHVQAGSACRLSRAETGAPLSRPARVGVRCKRASLELQRLGVNAPSDYRQKRHAAHHLTFVPLPDIPAGQSEVGVVSVYNRSAATVTQAGGDECALPAFFAQAPAGQRAGPEEPASGEALRVSETLGGVLGPVGGF